ncbi:MAG: PEP-CTERM sorting domain-containing protein [bacterium]|nr:PEP-CTERM sorting domain-containing protein [bacterium]
MKKLILVSLSLACLIASPVSATSIEIVDFDAGHTFLNFDELANGEAITNQYAALGALVSGTLGDEGTGAASTVYAYSLGLGTSNPNYIGQEHNTWDGSVIFDFFGLNVTQFGGVIVDSASNWLSVYDTNNQLIETVLANGTVYDFVGIDTGSTPIGRAIFSGDFYAIDDVRFNGSPVPEPATMGLLGLGLAAAGLKRKSRKA